MNAAKRILFVLVPLVAVMAVMGCPQQDPLEPPSPGVAVQLETLYIDEPVRLATNAPSARFVSLQLSGRSEDELRGTLILDPNVCSLSAFGDRQGCTKIAVRGIEVAVRRMTITDPTSAMRRAFQVTGDGLPPELVLIVQGRLAKGGLERAYLKLGTELVPLYVDDGL